MFLTSVLSLMDGHNIKYQLSQLSPAYSPDELEANGLRLGLGLVEAILFDCGGTGLAMAVIPKSLAIDYAGFSNLLAPRLARPLSESEIGQIDGLRGTAHIPPFGQLFNAEVHLSPLLAKTLLIGFFIDTEHTLITLKFSEFQRLLEHGQGVPVPTKSKYRAYSRPLRKKHDNCILGISLENAEFQTPKLVAITEWIRNRFNKCVVMMGDGLHRITLKMDSDVPENRALEYSKWLARDYVNTQQDVFNLRESA